MSLVNIISGLFLMQFVDFFDSAAIQYTNYTVENAVPFKGNNATSTSPPLCDIGDSQTLECNSGSKLDDDNIGKVPPNYGDFFAFSRLTEEPAVLQFHLSAYYNDMIDIVIHFFNYPDQSIGLPTLSVQTSDLESLPISYDDNHDLSFSDATLRNVTLQVLLHSLLKSIDSLIITISFPDHSNIDWLLLSEVDMYNDSNIELQGSPYSIVVQGPNDLQSTVRFMCTVTDSGSFEWVWEYNGNIVTSSGTHRYRIWIADATRSSQLEINNIRNTDNGEYYCIVNRQGGYSRRQRTFKLDLRAHLEPQFTAVVSSIGSTAILQCEAHGYLPSNIEWSVNDQLVQAAGNYSLITSSGSLDSVGVNGNKQKSQIVALQIKDLSESDEGVYVCFLGDLRVNVSLRLGIPTVVDPVTPEIVNCISSDTLSVQLVVHLLLGLLLIASNIACIEICRRKNLSKAKIAEKGCQVRRDIIPLYAEVGLQSTRVTRSLETIKNKDNVIQLDENRCRSMDDVYLIKESEL